MDGQVTAGTLVCAIPTDMVGEWLSSRFTELHQELTRIAAEYLKPGMGPEDARQFELVLEGAVRELARSFTEWCFSSLEPKKSEALPERIENQGDRYRRLNSRTPHKNIITRFGNITLTRAMYRRGSRGETIAPLEKILGIERGATPGALDLVGRQVAAAGSSQGRSIEVIAERTGANIGPEKLRNLTSYWTFANFDLVLEK